MPNIRRRFADLADRQIHYRETEGDFGNAQVPLIALHQLPGSSRGLIPVLKGLQRKACAPDLAGIGASDPHSSAAPAIKDHAADILALADSIGAEKFDLFGTHTGAIVALEIARTHPNRIRKLVLEGVSLLSPEKAQEYAERYCPPVDKDPDGLHLLRTWGFCRDLLLFWPWYNRTASGLRGNGLLPTEAMHPWVLDVLGNLDALPAFYQAAFPYPVAQALAEISLPTLFIARGGDPLAENTAEASTKIAGAQLVHVTAQQGPAGMAEALEAFLG